MRRERESTKDGSGYGSSGKKRRFDLVAAYVETVAILLAIAVIWLAWQAVLILVDAIAWIGGWIIGE
jgi:hypothetical protein